METEYLGYGRGSSIYDWESVTNGDGYDLTMSLPLRIRWVETRPPDWDAWEADDIEITGIEVMAPGDWRAFEAAILPAIKGNYAINCDISDWLTDNGTEVENVDNDQPCDS